MFLVDTSVWIETFRREDPLELESVIAFDEVVTCLPVIQEVLQGFRDDRAYRLAMHAMLALPLVESPLTFPVYQEAIGLYRSARRQGITLRSSVDCLVAACAIRNGLSVLHRDRDYPQLARISGLEERAC